MDSTMAIDLAKVVAQEEPACNASAVVAHASVMVAHAVVMGALASASDPTRAVA